MEVSYQCKNMKQSRNRQLWERQRPETKTEKEEIMITKTETESNCKQVQISMTRVNNNFWMNLVATDAG